MLYCTSDRSINKPVCADHKSKPKSPREQLRYTFGQRKHDSMSKDLNDMIEKKKKQNKIKEKQTNLNKFTGSKKSSSYQAFADYIVARKQEEKELLQFYDNKLFRIRSWKTYRKRQRSEDLFLQTFEKKFGKDVIIAFGDWGKNSNPNLKNNASSPNCRLLKKFKHRLQPYNSFIKEI